eukprot:2124239-Pyramimonas_sp.AAC.1
MRGHPAITAKWFLTGTAGVVARGLRCAGPPTRRWALVLDKDGGGRHAPRCVPSRAHAHLTHSARSPNVAHLARLECAAHLAHSEH